MKLKNKLAQVGKYRNNKMQKIKKIFSILIKIKLSQKKTNFQKLGALDIDSIALVSLWYCIVSLRDWLVSHGIVCFRFGIDWYRSVSIGLFYVFQDCITFLV